MAKTLKAHSAGLARATSWSLHAILFIIFTGWLDLPFARTVLHGPKPVRAIEVRL